jgi:putative redox protein
MGMASRQFDFCGSEGQSLSGRLDEPEGPVLGYAIFAHCFTCTRNSIAAVRISRALMAKGIGVLSFDFTGLGQSGGDFADSSFSGNIRDLNAAASAMKAAGHTPSLLIGHSFGGAAVLAAAGDLPTIKAVATVAAPFDVQHIRRQFGDDLATLDAEGEAKVTIGGRPFSIKKGFLDDLAQHDQAQRIRALKRPLLLMHAPLDQYVSIDNASLIFDAARHPKSFVSLDGADHLLTRAQDANYVADVIAAWASRYLFGAPSMQPEVREGFVTVEETGGGVFQLEVSAGGAHFHADEPISVGGLGSGPTPYELLGAGLAACTAMTLRLYARSKSMPLERIGVTVSHMKIGEVPRDCFLREISLTGPLSADESDRLLEIADRCPVHRTLTGGATIKTGLGTQRPLPNIGRPSHHADDMEQSILHPHRSLNSAEKPFS